MWLFENPIRKKMRGLMADMLQLKLAMNKIQQEIVALQEECKHHHKTVVTNESNEDWTSCEDCGKLLYR